MIQQTGFDIIISSDEGYERLCAEIYYDGEFIAIISQEDDNTKSIIEFVDSKIDNNQSFDCLEFINTLRQAYDLL